MGGYSGRALRDLRTAGWSVTETFHPGGSLADWHAHERAHLCLVVAGALVDQAESSERECQAGAVLYFPAGVSHRDRFLDQGARCLNLRPPCLAASRLPRSDAPLVLSEPRTSWAAAGVYDRIHRSPADGLEGPELERLIEASAMAADPATAPAPDWLRRARALIEEAWADDVRLATLAERLGVSRFHLARRFRERYGCSVGEYVQRLRVMHARDLLLATDAGLSEIAFKLGFSDQSHFTRVFGRLAGLTPARYRDAA